jgi:hypothetical protein
MQDREGSDPAGVVDDQVVDPAPGSDEASTHSAPEVRLPPDPQLPEREPQSFVYALGQIDARFPSLGVEKEFAHVGARRETKGLTERQVVKAAIADPGNRYLARQLCWLFLIEGFETYILRPRDPRDFRLLIDAYREYPSGDDVDVVIGERGQLAPPEACNGVTVPIVAFDQVYSFDRDSLLNAIPRPPSVPEDREEQFRQDAGGMFARIMQMADNAGATDEHRALNYLSVRYPQIYGAAAEAHDRDASLSGVDVRLSSLSGVRKIVDVVFSFTHRQTDVTDKQFVRVDVTEEYPFLVTKMSPYFER